MVLVTFNSRDLASAPEVRWRARAGAPALRAGAEAEVLGSFGGAGADDNVVKVWHTSLWTPVRDLESRGHTDGVMCLAFNEQGSLLVSGSADRTLIVWDSHTWAPMQVRRLEISTWVLFNSKGISTRVLKIQKDFNTALKIHRRGPTPPAEGPLHLSVAGGG